MTEASPVEVQAAGATPAAESADDPGSEGSYCRHCGQPSSEPHTDGEDWLCTSCERFQDAMICPTCGGLARISALPAEMAPPPHAPARRRKAKE